MLFVQRYLSYVYAFFVMLDLDPHCCSTCAGNNNALCSVRRTRVYYAMTRLKLGQAVSLSLSLSASFELKNLHEKLDYISDYLLPQTYSIPSVRVPLALAVSKRLN